jgi:hypothetical protein
MKHTSENFNLVPCTFCRIFCEWSGAVTSKTDLSRKKNSTENQVLLFVVRIDSCPQPTANTAKATSLPSLKVFLLSAWQAFAGFMKPKSASWGVGAKPSVNTI